ncbi:hypothetical protein KKB83_04385 [Patescibacteria group bacterium]|nr:hypothetical protein [Patescibacteria group bacterium]
MKKVEKVIVGLLVVIVVAIIVAVLLTSFAGTTFSFSVGLKTADLEIAGLDIPDFSGPSEYPGDGIHIIGPQR